MMVATVPSFIITLTIFLIVSILHDAPSAAQAADFSHDLKATFNITPWLFLVPVVTALLIVKKVSAIVTLFLVSLVAGIAALFFQPHIIASVANGFTPDQFTGLSFLDGFKGLFITYYGSTAIDTGNAVLNDLVTTRGMTGAQHCIPDYRSRYIRWYSRRQRHVTEPYQPSYKVYNTKGQHGGFDSRNRYFCQYDYW